MKKLLFTLLSTVLLLGFSHTASASHAAGGDITYKYVGPGPNGVGYEYCVYVVLYRDVVGASMPTSVNVAIGSSCGSVGNVTMQRNFLGTPPDYDACVDQPPGREMGKYEACGIILPTKCVDWTFSYSLCCRNNAITNLQAPSSRSMYLESTLNNTLGQNTSGQFINPGNKSFCVGRPFTWSQAATEPDGDSIGYELAQPYTGPNQPIPWVSPFTTQAPMSTTNGFNLNPRTGVIYFTPSQQEIDVIKILVKEYRYDSVYSQWLQIGTAIREMQIPVIAACSPLAQSGIQLDTSSVSGTGAGSSKMDIDSLRKTYDISAVGNDSTFVPGQGWTVTLPGIPYTCYDSVITMEFSTKVKCSSFSSDASEFRVIGPDKIARPVVAVNTLCGTDELTDKVELYLHKPLDSNGNYLLYLKNGSDGDVLENECGFGIKPFYGMMIMVDDCPILDYELLNVSVENDRNIRIDWDADPTSFSENLFTSWKILRANNDWNFYLLDTALYDVHARTFLDTTLGYELVDGSPFQYAVQLVQNYNYKRPTNTARTILLKNNGNNNDSTGTKFEWTNYDGWDSASYELQVQQFDTSGTNIADPWRGIAGPQAGLFTHTFLWPDYEEDDSKQGIYVFRVHATEPHNANNPFISESNWIYIQFITPPDPEIPVVTTGIIPNVFTPNGDLQNELFLLPTNTYSNVTISVYNRWGKLVYEDVDAPKEDYLVGGKGWDGTDMNSGNKLADGTYFYVIQFNDDLSGQNEQVKGNVSIFGLGTK